MKLLTNLAKSLAISISIAGIFLLYLYLIGIPMTRARNLYNQAMRTTDVDQQIALLEESLRNWHEQYVADALASVSQE